ncbi:MAG TPA: glycosyltransferase family 39 protein [Pyrinomonadaceae bacterium]|jgi:4-amino-4-deoxy-L-arabinose transferase-like glycosyltransferase|nr:glycosyltransferase family 39 protein [Pyrinomonadaceae bacterium]
MAETKRVYARLLSRRGAACVLLPALMLAAGFAFYVRGAATNPPGFFIDESSIAFNAHTISQTGEDEYGEPFPLYFRAFSDYKNPVYVYLLAAVFRVTGPSITAARLLSAALGALTALVLALLGVRISGSRAVGLLTWMTALLTPWLFELSRLVLEVAAYPLAVALLLLFLWRASRREAWRLTDALAVALALALLTYTYSIGRLLAPMLALGLFVFATTRARLRSVLKTLGLYALTLTPLVVFNFSHPGALTERFKLITYVTPQSGYAQDAFEFVKHYAANLSPWAFAVTGDPNEYNVVGVNGTPLVLAASLALALAGVWLAVAAARRDAWWRFVLYGLLASAVPASLTNEYVHALRLAPVAVFLVVLTVPPLARLLEEGRSTLARRSALAVLMLLTLAQGLLFRARYDEAAASPKRMHIFDSGYAREILPAALALPQRPVYLYDAQGIPGYMQAYWHATIQGVPLSNFAHLGEGAEPPEGSAVITTRDICVRCRVVAEEPPYVVYVAGEADRTRGPMNEGAFRAEVTLTNAPASMRAGGRATLRVVVENASGSVWPGRAWKSDAFQVGVGNHWLDAEGREVAHDDGRAPLTSDLRPGESREMELTINAPKEPGEYTLEVDVLQEGISWFALKGSKTSRTRVRVESGWFDW